MRILKPALPIRHLLPIKIRQPATGGAHNRVAGGDVPLHGAAQARVQVGFAGGNQADLERGAGVAEMGDFLAVEEGGERFGIGVGAAGDDGEAFFRDGSDGDGPGAGAVFNPGAESGGAEE